MLDRAGGDADAATERLEAAASICADLGETESEAACREDLAELARKRGDRVAARLEWERAAEL